jgi:hypothetical protein
MIVGIHSMFPDSTTNDGPFGPHLPATTAQARRRTRGMTLVVPLLVGGAFAVVALAGRSKVGAWLRGFLSAGAGDTRRRLRLRLQHERHPGGLPALRQSLLGRTKAQVAARFGPPRTAVIRQAAPVASGTGTVGGGGGGGALGQIAFWRADTWYYALDPDAQTAMAVAFHDDVATDVDFFDAPRK